MTAQWLAATRDAQRISPSLVMRDPYILDFPGLRYTWQEGDLEAAIIRENWAWLHLRRSAETYSDRRR